MTLAHENILAKFILSNVKNDDKFFDEFMKFLERQNKRYILLAVVRRILIDECKKVYS